jgi:hypothetical protein
VPTRHFHANHYSRPTQPPDLSTVWQIALEHGIRVRMSRRIAEGIYFLVNARIRRYMERQLLRGHLQTSMSEL